MPCWSASRAVVAHWSARCPVQPVVSCRRCQLRPTCTQRQFGAASITWVSRDVQMASAFGACFSSSSLSSAISHSTSGGTESPRCCATQRPARVGLSGTARRRHPLATTEVAGTQPPDPPTAAARRRGGRARARAARRRRVRRLPPRARARGAHSRLPGCKVRADLLLYTRTPRRRTHRAPAGARSSHAARCRTADDRHIVLLIYSVRSATCPSIDRARATAVRNYLDSTQKKGLREPQ